MRRKGFTRLEMMSVFTLAIFLSLLIALGFEQARIKSYDSRRLSDVFAIKKALELYFLDNNTYPKGFNVILGETGARCLSKSGFQDECRKREPIYMSRIPKSPGSDSFSYIYTSSASTNTYMLIFYLQTDMGQYRSGQRILTPDGIK